MLEHGHEEGWACARHSLRLRMDWRQLGAKCRVPVHATDQLIAMEEDIVWPRPKLLEVHRATIHTVLRCARML